MNNKNDLPLIPLFLNNQCGFNLIEVIVSVVISALALIGLAGLHISSVNTTTVAYAQLHAVHMMSEMVDQMRSNVDAAKQGAFDIDAVAGGNLKAFSDMGSVPDNSASTIENIKYYWFQNLDGVLPDAKSAINCTTTGKCVLKVEYSNVDKNRLASQATLEQVLSVQL
jgi:type IV pilus assembly protein PilV